MGTPIVLLIGGHILKWDKINQCSFKPNFGVLSALLEWWNPEMEGEYSL